MTCVYLYVNIFFVFNNNSTQHYLRPLLVQTNLTNITKWTITMLAGVEVAVNELFRTSDVNVVAFVFA